MAVLTLTKTFITNVSTGVSISAQSLGESPTQYDMKGDVETFAGGGQRSIASEGEAGTHTEVLTDLSLSTIDTLRLWKGQTVFLRNWRGEAFYGVFYSVPVMPRAYEISKYIVTLTLRVVTVVEGV